MKNILLVLLIFIGNLSIAQNSNKFSSEPSEFEPELLKFLKNKDKSGESITNEFVEKYVNFSDDDKSKIIDILNNARLSKITDFKHFNKFLKSVILIDDVKKGNNQNISSWLTSYKKYFENKKYKKKEKQKFIESNFNAIKNSVLSPDSKIEWKVFEKLTYDSSEQIQYSFSNTDLICTSGTDSLFIYRAKGSFLPEEQKIKVNEATIYWNSKIFSSDSLFVTAKNFDIYVKNNNYKVDSVIFNSGYFINKKILGHLEDKTESSNTKKEIYPVFTSYIKDYYFKNFAEGVDFNGGIMVKRNTFYGIGSNENRALLLYKKSNKKVFSFRSNGFVFKNNSFHSSKTDISISIKEDSIYHPEVAMNYDIVKRKLLVSKNNTRMSTSAYSNSYNNLDMYIKNLLWYRDSTNVIFNTENHINVPYVSNKYYEREIFKQFQGTNRMNPLVKLRNMYDYYDGMNYYPIELVANHMKMSYEYSTHMLMELASLGYVYIEQDLARVRFSEKFLNLVDAHKRKIDYDVITFQTPEGKPTRASINIDTGDILILGINRINLSKEKQVYVFPSDSVTVSKNLDFKFNGDMLVGNYEFHGSRYNFIYDDFKVVMNGHQQMQFFVPSWFRNRDGKYYYVKVRNPIDSLKGELYIDAPENKSGRLKLVQYPIFNNTKDAYVFYDLPAIKDSVYKRNELFVKLFPFELDSLNAISPRNVKFEGTVATNGIFPDFDYYVNVQKDYSLGFIYDTEIDGMKLYDQANFRDEVSLNMEGLNARGRIDYLSSEMESTNIELYPDSLQSVVSTFAINYIKTKELNTPSVATDSVFVHWEPKVDSMTIYPLDKPFIMYDSILTNEGFLAFNDKKLYGGGNISFETAEMISENYKFYADYFEGEKMNFDLRENMDSPFEFGIDNAYGKVDLSNRKGYFLLQEENASVEFIANKYEAYINNIVWNIDDKTIDLKSTNIDQIPWFVSVDPTMDSLRFQAKIAQYSLITNEINASYLEGIEVADAMIYPDSLKLVVMDNGWMEGFENASVKIGVGKHEHILENAYLEIESSKQFRGTADYFYTDIDKIKHPIHFNEIYVDTTTNSTLARGDLLVEEDFMLNPYFSFNGKVEVSGESQFLKFKGYSGIQNYCDNIETGEIPIYDNVDPNNVRVQIKNFDNLARYSFIYNGIYAVDSSYSAAFLSTDRSLLDVDFISAKGRISYDEPEACYVIGGDTVNSIIENEVRFYNDECRLGAKGEMKFYNPDQVIDIRAFGEIDYDMNSEEMNADLLLGINFEFDKKIMDAIRQDLELAGSLDVMDKESDLQKMAFSRILNKPYSGSEENRLSNFGQKIPEQLQFSMLLSDMKFKWDAEQNLFLSEQRVSLHNFNGAPISKIFNGRVEIKKRRGGDEYTIYLISQSGKYYYFRYRDNVLDFYTNQKLIMEMFDEIEDEDRSYEVDGIKFRFKKASRLKVKTFQKKYT